MLTPISNFQAGSDVWEGVNMVETKAGFLALKILRSSALYSSTRIRDDHFSAFDSRPKLAPDETIRKILPLTVRIFPNYRLTSLVELWFQVETALTRSVHFTQCNNRDRKDASPAYFALIFWNTWQRSTGVPNYSLRVHTTQHTKGCFTKSRQPRITAEHLWIRDQETVRRPATSD